MSSLSPFRALRPAPEAASQVASVPYDVVTTGEARAIVAENPLSFLRVTRAEADLPRAIADYVAGMTDRYAIREHRRLFSVEET